MRVELIVNGEMRTVEVEPRMSLLDCLRERLLLTGAHAGCEHGVCAPVPCSSTALRRAPA